MFRILLPFAALAGALALDPAVLNLGKAFLGHSVSLSAPWVLPGARITLLVVFLLAWRWRRGRVAWSILALALALEAPRLLPGTPPGALPLVLSLLLPLHLAAAAWLREWWVASTQGALRLGVFAAEAAAVVWALRPAGAQTLESLANRGRPEDAEPAGFLQRAAPLLADGAAALGLPSGPSLAAFGIGTVLALLALWRRRSAIEAGLVAALFTVFASFVVSGGAQPLSPFYLGAAGLALGLALVEDAFGLAFLDGLTGLPGRRALEEQLRQLGRSYALAMVDLDHFKKLNDRHGHEVGDQVLRMVATRLGRVSGGGRAFRYGGEEFTVVFPGTTAQEASDALETLRQDIAERRFAVRAPGRPKGKAKAKGAASKGAAASRGLAVTVSIGVAERSDANATPERVLKSADKALYRSKKAGRNRITVGR